MDDSVPFHFIIDNSYTYTHTQPPPKPKQIPSEAPRLPLPSLLGRRKAEPAAGGKQGKGKGWLLVLHFEVGVCVCINAVGPRVFLFYR